MYLSVGAAVGGFVPTLPGDEGEKPVHKWTESDGIPSI